MPRVKRGMMHVKKRRNLKKRVRGFIAGRKKLIKLAKTADTHAGMHAHRDRRRKKREFRQLWQVQINAAVRAFDMSYSVFMGALKKRNINLDRKVLAKIAGDYPKIFESIVTTVKQ